MCAHLASFVAFDSSNIHPAPHANLPVFSREELIVAVPDNRNFPIAYEDVPSVIRRKTA